MAPRQKRRVTLSDLVGRRWPAWDDATIAAAIAGGEIRVEGRILTNPGAWVGADSAVRHRPAPELAGRRKLAWAITRFGVAAGGRTVLDVGASTGGFTTAWLDAGAARVYAVDVGHGQLLGSLRQDPRVVNLERTNVSDLTPAVIPVPVEVVSVDVSYLSLTAAVARLGAVALAGEAELLGLVKPMFELRLPTIPEDPTTLRRACAVAVAGLTDQGWEVAGADECPVRGGKGAVEFFVHARAPG